MKSGKELSFFALYQKFIRDCAKGKRLQPNGKRLSTGTISNYVSTMRLVKTFCEQRKFELRIRPTRYLNKRDIEVEKKLLEKIL